MTEVITNRNSGIKSKSGHDIENTDQVYTQYNIYKIDV